MSNLPKEVIMHTHSSKSVTPKSALRLVNTKALSRETWLNVRKKGIGSSDAAASVGLNALPFGVRLCDKGSV